MSAGTIIWAVMALAVPREIRVLDLTSYRLGALVQSCSHGRPVHHSRTFITPPPTFGIPILCHPSSHHHAFFISQEGTRTITRARTRQKAGAWCNSTLMCRVQKVILITLFVSIHHPYHPLVQVEASLRSRNPLWFLRQTRLWGHLSRW